MPVGMCGAGFEKVTFRLKIHGFKDCKGRRAFGNSSGGGDDSSTQALEPGNLLERCAPGSATLSREK